MLYLNYCESVCYDEIKIFLKNYEKNHLKNLEIQKMSLPLRCSHKVVTKQTRT